MLPIVLAHLNQTTSSNASASIWSMWNNIDISHHQSINASATTNHRTQTPPTDNHHPARIMTTGGAGSSSTSSTEHPTTPVPRQKPSPSISAGGGCFARTAIPKNSRSAPVSSRSVDFAGRSRACRWEVSVVPGSQQLHFTDDLSSPSSSHQPQSGHHHWIAHARLADDVHSHNAVVEVHRSSSSSSPTSSSQPTAPQAELRVRVLCDMSAGDELMLWFSEELLALLHIPFLTPANIRGKNTYTCNVCQRSFEYPNPLKIHLATDCERLTRDDLWRRMDSALAAENLSTMSAAAAAAAATTSAGNPLLPFASTVQHLQSWLSGTMQHQPHHHPLLRPFLFGDRIAGAAVPHSRPSAFQPPPSSVAGAGGRLAANGSPSSSTSPDLTAAAMTAMMLPTAAAAYAMPTGYSSLPGGMPLLMSGRGSPIDGHHNHQHPASMVVQLQQQQQHQAHHFHHHPLLFGHPHPSQRLHHHHHHHHGLLDVEACSTATASSAAAAAAHLETIVSNMGSTAAHSSKHHQLQQHHHQHQHHPSGGQSTATTVAGGHLCIYCGKVYSRKYGLKIHIRTHTGFKPLKCPYCARPFGDPSNLNKHVRLHVQGSTIYKCPVAECDKILVRRRDLQRHMQTQHAIGDGDGGGVEEADAGGEAAMHDAAAAGRRQRCLEDNGGDDDGDDEIGGMRTKRVRSESSSPAVSSGASSPSFMVDELSSDDD